MRKALIIAAGILVLAGCGTAEPEPDMSDDALAREMSEYVYGQPLEATAAGPEESTRTAVASAEANCAFLRKGDGNGMIDADDAAASRFTLSTYEENFEPWEVDKVRKGMLVSAKYRCPEFYDMLRVYVASAPN